MVVAEARQRATNPDIKKDEEENLNEKPEQWRDYQPDSRDRNVQALQGAMPSTKEEQSGQAAHRDHIAVLRHEEHRKLHSAVLGVITSNQFSFRLGQIERDAVRLRVGGHNVNEKCDELESSEEVPAKYGASLRIDDLPEAQTSRQQQDSDQREAERQFITNELRAGAKRTQ